MRMFALKSCFTARNSLVNVDEGSYYSESLTYCLLLIFKVIIFDKVTRKQMLEIISNSYIRHGKISRRESLKEHV